MARAELRKLQRRLPRRFRVFEPLLPLMQRIFDEKSARITADEPEKSTNSVRIVHQADSSKVWERFLEIGLEKSGHHVQQQASFNRTWNIGDKKNVDISLNGGIETY